MKSTYYVAASLDGFIAEADGGVGFLDVVGEEQDPQPYNDFFASVDAMVMGKRTYDQVLGFGVWPYGETRCLVMTHESIGSDHESVTAFQGGPREVIGELQASNHEHLWVVGGGNIASQFLANSLLDQLIVTIIPVILGKGIPLVSEIPTMSELSLEAHTPRGEKMIELKYSVRK